MRWWDGSQWTTQTQPYASPGGSYGPAAPPSGPYGQAGPTGPGYGRRRGFGGGGYGSTAGQTFWGRNRMSLTALVVAAIYIGIAVATRFVLFGIVPLLMSMRAVRAREQLAPLAVVAAILTIVVAVATLTSH